jgi:glycosyltransferase involved in cell wall biosynthesis
MKILVMIPSYNDAYLIPRIIRIFERKTSNYVKEYSVIDDSDDEKSLQALEALNNTSDKIKVIHNEKRLGKWYAWKIAFELMAGDDFDALIELDADIVVKHPERIIEGLLQGYDIVTCYSHYLPPHMPWTILYEEMHKAWMKRKAFAFGGQCLGLSRKAVESFRELGLFEQPIFLDDYLLSLCGALLRLKCVSIDSGMQLKLPARLHEWIMYRLRHNMHILKALFSQLERLLGVEHRNAIEAIAEEYHEMYKWALAKAFLKNPLSLLAIPTFIPSFISSQAIIIWPRLDSER